MPGRLRGNTCSERHFFQLVKHKVTQILAFDEMD